MRTIGFLLAVVGGLLAYLGMHGKVGQAFTAIKSGSYVPTTDNPAAHQSTTIDSPSGPVSVTEVGGGNTRE